MINFFKPRCSIYYCFILALLAVFFLRCKKQDGVYYNAQLPAPFSGSVYEYLRAQPKGVYDSLLTVVERLPNIKSALQGSSAVSIFAPDNQSFANAVNGLNQLRLLQKRRPLYLRNITDRSLDTLLSRYIFPEILNVDSLALYSEGRRYTSLHYGYEMQIAFNRNNANGVLEGGALELEFTDPKRSIFRRFWISTYTVTSGIKAANGNVYDIASSHVFGFGDFLLKFLTQE